MRKIYYRVKKGNKKEEKIMLCADRETLDKMIQQLDVRLVTQMVDNPQLRPDIEARQKKSANIC